MRRMSEKAGPLAGGATQNWISLGLMVVVGAIAMLSLYLGFREYGRGNVELSLMYLLIGVSGFSAIGFSFFKAKPVATSKDPSKEVPVVTTLECPQCNLKKVRDFQVGDYIFKKGEPCERCEGEMVITRINARKEPKKR